MDPKEQGLSSISDRVFGGMQDGFMSDMARLHFLLGADGTGLDSPSFNSNRSSLIGFTEDNPYGSFLMDDYKRLAQSRYSANPDYAQEALSRAVTYEAVNTISADVQNLIMDSSKVFRKVFSSFDLKGTYGMFSNMSPEDANLANQTSRDMMSSFMHRLIGSAAPEMAEQYGYQSSVLNWGEHALNEIIERDLKDAAASSYQIASELDGTGLMAAKRLLQNTSYVSRPGILPAAALIQDASSKLTIDIYQLQNKSIMNLLTTKILTNPELNVDVRLAYIGESVYSDESFGILGPNAAAVMQINAIKKIRESVDYKNAYGGRSIGNINVLIGDEKNHQKMLVSENAAIIGTQNLTNPIGNSLYQSGSNYEVVRVLNNIMSVGYTSSELRASANIKDSSETLLYRQARNVADLVAQRRIKSEQSNILGSYETYDLMKTTVDALYGMSGGRTGIQQSNLFLTLDQTFLLGYEESIGAKYALGEMGAFGGEQLGRSKSPVVNRAFENYRETQLKVMKMLITGQAQAVVDVRNYRQTILDPTYERLQSVIGDEKFGEYEYSIGKLVNKLKGSRKFGSADELIGHVANQLSLMSGTESNSSKLQGLATQLLAIDSGNIINSVVSRQHSKGFFAEVAGKGAAFVSTSSNLGFYSSPDASISGEDEKLFNTELGIGFINREALALHRVDPSSLRKEDLSEDQVLYQLGQASKFARENYSQLAGRDSQLYYQDVDRRAEWERNVDTKKTTELMGAIKALGRDTGLGEGFFKASYMYSNRGERIGVQVEIDRSKFGTGVRKVLKFATLKGVGKEDGFIHEIGSGRMIGNSLFVNESGIAQGTGFSRDGIPLVIGVGKREKLSSLETTLSIISSLTIDIAKNSLIDSPYDYYRSNLAKPEALTSAVTNMMLSMSGNRLGSFEDLINPERMSKEVIQTAALRFISKITNSAPILDHVRDLAGFDVKDPSRRDSLEGDLMYMFEVFANSDREERYNLLVGQNKTSSITGLIRSMIEDKKGPVFADLLYELVRSQGDTNYDNRLGKSIKESVSSIFEVFLTYGQVRNYASTQAINKMPVYGVSDSSSRTRWSQDVSRGVKSNNPLLSLFSYALVGSPYEYNASSTMGTGDDLYFRGVAEGGASREINDRGRNVFIDGYAQSIGVFKHDGIGLVTRANIINDMGVGLIADDKVFVEYLTSIARTLGEDSPEYRIIEKKIADSRKDFEGDVYLFNFGASKKAYQIPQRLKNVIGNKPLYDISEAFQDLLEGVGSKGFKGIEYNGKLVASSSELRKEYLSNLKNKLGMNSDDTRLDNLEVGALYSGKIKNFLSREMISQLDRIKRDVEAQFEGLDINSEVGQEVLRATLIANEFNGSSVKGFIGSSHAGGRSVMVLQLSGAYSDPFLANPDYGRKGGLRQGFMDKSVKSVKASMLSARFNIDDLNNSLENYGYDVMKNLAMTGDEIIRFDADSNAIRVYKKVDGKYRKDRLIDSRSQFDLLRGVIESRYKDPSISKIQAKSSLATLIGEKGIESIRSIRLLSGSPDTNEIEIEVSIDKTLVAGGGRRLEAITGLFKGVAMYVYGGVWSRLTEDLNKNIGASSGLLGGELQTSQIIGIASPSNLKGYFFEHGAEVLLNKSIRKSLTTGVSDATLAFGLISTFGVDSFGGIGSEDLYEAIGRKSIAGEFGDYYKSVAAGGMFKSGLSGKVRNQRDLYIALGKGMVSVFEDSGGDKSYKNMQLNTLRGLSTTDLLAALNGTRGKIGGYLDTIFDKNTGGEGSAIRSDLGVVSNSLMGRELSILAGSLHLVSQYSLSKPFQMTMAQVDDMSTLQKLISIMDIDVANGYKAIVDKIISEGADKYLAVIDRLSNSFTPAVIFNSTSAAQGKVALGSRKGANLEAQHIIPTSFHLQTKAFSSGGGPEVLGKLFAGFLGAVVQASPDQMLQYTSGLSIIDLMSGYGRSSVFAATSIGVYAGFESDNYFREASEKYRVYSLAQSVLSNIESYDYGDETRKLLVDSIVTHYGKPNAKGDVVKRKSKFVDETLIGMIKGGSSQSDLLYYVNSQMKGLLQYFGDVEKQFSLYEDKALSIDFSEAVTRGMKASGSKTFGFSMPRFEFDARGKITAYMDQSIYGISLSGEAIAALGEQFGDFLSEEQRAMIELWRGFAPGSKVSNLLSRFYNEKMSGGSNVISIDASIEEMEALRSFQAVAMESPIIFQNATVGRRMQQIFGNKLTFDGGVFTAGSSFLVPDRVAIQPEELQNRYGARVSENRLGYMTQINNALNRDMSGLSKANAHLARQFLMAQKAFLEVGVSAGASEKFKRLSSDLAAIDAMGGQEGLDFVNDRLRFYSKLGYQKTRAEGDYFIQLVAMRELEMRKLKFVEDGEFKSELIQRQQIFDDLPMALRGEGITIGRGYYASRPSGRLGTRLIEEYQGRLRPDYGYDDKLVAESELDLDSDSKKKSAWNETIGLVPERHSLLLSIQALKATAKEYRVAIGEIGKSTALDASVRDSVIFGRENRMMTRGFTFNQRLAAIESRVNAAGDDSNKLGYAKDELDSLSREFLVEYTLVKSLVFRSSPPGNQQLLSSMFANAGLSDLSRVMKSAGVDFDFGTNAGRNSTLGIMNPIGMLVSMLGDYDGDSLITVMDQSVKMRLERNVNDKRIKALEASLKGLDWQKQTVMVDAVGMQAIVDKQIEIEGKLDSLYKKNNELNVVLSKADYYISNTGFESAARAWFSAYTKLDERMFIDSNTTDSRGRAGWASESTPVSTLFTMIEQGRGLTPGIDGVWKKKVGTAYTAIEAIHEELGALGALTPEDRRGQFGNAVSRLLQSNRFAGLEEINNAISVMQFAPESFVNDIAAMKSNAELSKYVADLANGMTSNTELAGFVNKAFGTAVDKGTYELMNQVLSHAGSVILGQTYNSLIGVLYAESPVLSMANSFLDQYDFGDKGEALRQHIVNQASLRGEYLTNEMVTAKVNEFVGIAKEVKGSSQDLGGFLQTVNQLMRDSIKPKGAEGEFTFLETINHKLENYKNGNAEEKEAVVKDIVKDFGPGSGLRALMQLESLNNEFNTLRGNTADETKRDILEKQFGINVAVETELLDRLEYGIEGRGGMGLGTPTVRSSGIAGRMDKFQLIAAYKTKIDLVSQASAFAYERNLANGGTILQAVARDNYAGVDIEAYLDVGRDVISTIRSSRIDDDLSSLRTNVLGRHLDKGLDAVEMVDAFFDVAKTMTKKGSSGMRTLDINEDELKLYAYTYQKTKDQVESFAGKYGEKLEVLNSFNSQREAIVSNKLKGAIASSLDVNKDGLIMATVTAATSGKLDEKTIYNMALSLTDSFAGMHKPGELTDAAMLVKLMESRGFNSNTAYTEFTSLITGMHNGDDASKEYVEKMAKGIRHTFFGQIGQTVGKFIRETTVMDPSNAMSVGGYLRQLGVSEEISKRYETIINSRVNITNDKTEEHQRLDRLISNALRDNAKAGGMSTLVSKSYVESKPVESALLNKNTEVLSEGLLIPVIGLIGQAIATGSITAESGQQAFGNAITSLAYARSGTGGRITMAAFGTAFKGRQAIQEFEGDAWKAFYMSLARETSMAVASSIATPLATKAVGKMLGQRIRMFDEDRLEGVRGVASTVVGAAIGAAIGMFAGEAIGRAVVATGMSIWAEAVKAAQEYSANAKAEFEEDMANYEVSIDNGDDVAYANFDLYSNNEWWLTSLASEDVSNSRELNLGVAEEALLVS